MNDSFLLAPPETTATSVVVLRTTSGMMTNYNYLLVDAATRRAVLVDPSWQPEVIEHALAESRAMLDGVLLTHAHRDHIDLAGYFSEKYRCPAWMSAQEIAASKFHAPRLVAIDERPWYVGQMLIRPLLTPGHTAGCVCYYIDDQLFSGDVLFAEGCGICPSEEGAYQMFDSLMRLKHMLRPSTRIYPGHSFGRPVGQRFADVMRENIYLQFKDKQSFAAFRMRKGQSRAKLFEFH